MCHDAWVRKKHTTVKTVKAVDLSLKRAVPKYEFFLWLINPHFMQVRYNLDYNCNKWKKLFSFFGYQVFIHM